MTSSFISFSCRHAGFVLVLSAILIILGVVSLSNQNYDALPDTSDRQVIVYTTFNAPANLVQQKVTYPLSTALRSVENVKVVRGSSEYGMSLIYVVLDDNADLKLARLEVQQTIDRTRPLLPQDSAPQMGPDASGVGWIYQYALFDSSGERSLADLRDLQDWFLRFELQKVPGVAEVASVGGFEKQYQITVDPVKLKELNISLETVLTALQRSNAESGGRVLDLAGREYVIRGEGRLTSIADLANVVVESPAITMMAKTEVTTTRPILLQDIAQIQIGPDMRRGVTDLNGAGEAVGGIVIMRQGANAASVLRSIKDRLHALQARLPKGVRLVTTYDRSELIEGALRGFRNDLILAIVVVSLIIIVSLGHAPSALVPILTIPACLLIASLLLRIFNVPVNILTLCGFTLSVGVLVDGAIIQVENVYRRIGRQGADSGGRNAVVTALHETGPAVFISLLVITASFLPLLAFAGVEGRFFRPLILSKTLTMAVASVAVLTFGPAVQMAITRLNPVKLKPAWLSAAVNRLWVGSYRARNTFSPHWRLGQSYEACLRLLLRYPWWAILMAVAIVELTLPAFISLGKEFMPPFDEGTKLFMPTTSPGISIAAARELIQRQDRLLMAVPEVNSVFAKAGRADTATDPAPLSMVETTIQFRPVAEWRRRNRWYTDVAPEWLQQVLLRPLWADSISSQELERDLDRQVRMPGVVNAWTMPIQGRINMLATGAKTPLSIKVFGPEPEQIDQVARRIRDVLIAMPETKFAYADPLNEGYFLDIQFERDWLRARSIQLADAQQQAMAALGGIGATSILEGRVTRQVYVRYPRSYRDSVNAIQNLEIHAPNDTFIPLSELAKIRMTKGPRMLPSEDGSLVGYVYADTSASNINEYLAGARRNITMQVRLPPDCSIEWDGQFKDVVRLRDRLKWILPISLLVIALLIWTNTRSLSSTGLVLLAVPFSLVGSIWLLKLLGYKLSSGTWVGLIALLGLDAETGVFMLLYLDLAWKNGRQRGLMNSTDDLRDAVIAGAAKRIRPKLMTVTAAFFGLVPVMLSSGPGSDMMKRVVAPIVGGLASSFLLELLVYPPLFYISKRRLLKSVGEVNVSLTTP